MSHLNIKKAIAMDIDINNSLIFIGNKFAESFNYKNPYGTFSDLQRQAFDKDSFFTDIERQAIRFVFSCLRLADNNNFSCYNINSFFTLLKRFKYKDNFLPYLWVQEFSKIEQAFIKKNNKSNNNSNIYTSIENKFFGYCLSKWLCDASKQEQIIYLDPFKELVSKIINMGNTSLDIFTLNTDLLLETIFTEEGFLYTGFVDDKWVGFNFPCDNTNIYGNPHTLSGINYYKLYGSLDWVRLLNGEVVKRKSLINKNDVDISPLLSIDNNFEIYSIEPFFSLLNIFKTKLQEKQFYIFIGYDFFNPYINNFFALELLNNNKKAIIVDLLLSSPFVKEDFYIDYGLNILKDERKILFVKKFINNQSNPLFSIDPKYNIKTIPAESFWHITCQIKDFLLFLNNSENYCNNKINNKNFCFKKEIVYDIMA